MALPRKLDPVSGLLHRINEEVALLPEPVLRAFAPVLQQARLEVEKQLAAVLAKLPPPGSAGYIQPFTAHQLRATLLQLREGMNAITAAQKRLGTLGAASYPRTAKTAQDHTATELRLLSTRFESGLTPVPLVQAARLSTRLVADRYSRSAARWGLNANSDLRARVALGLVRGETIEEMTYRLLGRGNVRLYGQQPGPVQARVISEQLFRKYEFEARRLVRTEVINVYNAAKVDIIKQAHDEDSEVMQRWDAALDARTCALCRELDHVVVPVDKAFPGGWGHPPLHPHCRCAVVIWKSSWNEAGRVIRARGVSARPTVNLKSPRS